ncbi:F-box and WD repeat domain containing protein 10B isoform X2 [Heterodontus francisci]|uniref:F-box and WD repeat domain containing protein 10B isoform X2 n=1 Tax=Heterodontus francisci TaxID=7792 RepID=UPI00355AD8B7
MRMYDLDDGGEVAEFNIYSWSSQSCLTSDCQAPPCGSCSACTLQLRLASTRQWFLRAGDLSKQQFVIGLGRRIGNRDLLQQLDRLLQPTLGKDFTHSRSCVNPSLPEDLTTQSSDRSLDKLALRKFMLGTWQWFADSRHWTKTNYMLGLFQMCDVNLLYTAGNMIRTLIHSKKIPGSRQMKGWDRDEDVTSMNESYYTFKTEEHPELEMLTEIWPEYAVVSPDIVPKSLIFQSPDDIVTASVSSLRPKSEQMIKKQSLVWKSEQDTSSAAELTTSIIVTSSFQATSGVTSHKDFLRCLPIHLAKYILGFLDQQSLKRCTLVTRHWAYLAKEVTRDKLAHKCIFDELMRSQKIGKATKKQTVENIQKEMRKKSHKAEQKGTGGEKIRKKKGKGKETALEACVRQLENKDVHITKKKSKAAADTNVVQGTAPQNVNIVYAKICHIPVPRVDDKGFVIPTQSFRKKLAFGASYTGFHTDLIEMEERNVYCGPYNIIVLKQSRWNLKSTLCTNIYRGHMGVITCLDVHEDKFVSAGMDCQAKVWNLQQGKCFCSFRHEKPVLSVAINKMYVVSSCEKGLVHVWSIEPPSLVKVLIGHTEPVTCVSFDEWHLVSGSKDGSVKAWSMIGKFSECLMTFKHPQEVLCLHFLYLRVISGCSDGKIRVFDLCNGSLLRVMRANGRGDPVISLHLAGNRMVINTVSSVVKFHFEEITWDYTALAATIASLAPLDKFKMAPLRKQPYSYVRAQRMRRIGSTNQKIYHRKENVAEQGLLHHARFLSTRCMQAAQRIQSDSMKILNLRESQYRHQGATHIDLQSELSSKPASSGWVSRSPELLSQKSLRRDGQSRIGYGKRPESWSTASRLLSVSEQDTLKRIKKHGLYRPRTSDQIYLTVNAIHNSLRFDETSINTLYNSSLSEDWGRLLCPLEDTGKKPTVTPKKPKVKISSISDDVELTDECIDAKTLFAPFELKGQKFNQKFTFHHLDKKCFTTKPMITRSKSTLGFVDPVQFKRQKNRPQSALEEIAKKTRHITTGSKEGNRDKTLVDEKLKLQQSLNMNPYRNNSGFNLWTMKQQKAYAEKVVMEHNANQQRKEQESRTASRKAWLKKAEGTDHGPNLHK